MCYCYIETSQLEDICTVQYFFWKGASNQQAELTAPLYKALDMPSKVCYTDW